MASKERRVDGARLHEMPDAVLVQSCLISTAFVPTSVCIVCVESFQ